MKKPISNRVKWLKILIEQLMFANFLSILFLNTIYNEHIELSNSLVFLNQVDPAEKSS